VAASGRRISYDRFWGAVLLAGAGLPLVVGEAPWKSFREEADPGIRAWLAAGWGLGLLALGLGLSGWRSRSRHLINFVGGVALVALPVCRPLVWERFPSTNPASLPLTELGSVGWVMLLACVAIYAGSGIRIARPTQIAGQGLGALGALLLAVFAFLPGEGGTMPFGAQRVKSLFAEPVGRTVLPFLLTAAATVLATINLLRSRAEVALARMTRLLLVAAFTASLAMPLFGEERSRIVPVAWGSLLLLAPLFLALDAAVTYVAATITRGDD